MLKPFHFKIDIEIYRHTLHVFYLHTDLEFEKAFRKVITDNGFEEFKKQTTIFKLDGAGKYSSLEGASVVRFEKWENWNVEDLETINHELFHITHYILKHVGMKLSDKTEEAYAYLNSFLTKRFHQTLIQKTIKKKR